MASGRPPCRRTGLSLLEVILALAILMIAMLLIGQLIAMGVRSAAAARDLSRAQLLAETKLAELTVLGVMPRSQNQVPFGDNPEWLYSVDVHPMTGTGLVSVAVTVMPARASRQEEASLTLTRWIVDPTFRQTTGTVP